MTDFHDLTALSNLFQCWLKAKRNKGRFERIQRFGEDPLRYLLTIQKKLRERAYTFGPYKTFTVREKKWRDVVDAPMKDRIVHWMLYEYLLPIWQPRFIHDTYGNLPGRGTHAAVQRLADFCRSERNTWALQLDISKYFYAVPHDQLKARALSYIGDEEIRRLIISLIDSFRTDGRYDHLFAAGSRYRETAAKGMPIGNLSSQLFANIYLCDFDHWVKQTLRVRHYIRYVDDMVILGDNPEHLQQLCQQIVERMDTEGLTIHPRKIRLAPTAAGVPFLGYVVSPNSISAGQRLRRRYHYRLRQHEAGQDRSEALNSYRAALAFTGSTRAINERGHA
jgi:RNA-directed DNA polymerase